MIAAGYRSLKVVELLVSYGANINYTYDNGYSVLMKATCFGTLEILEYLLKQKADPNKIRDVDGITALMFAVSIGDAQKVLLLLGYGADKNIIDLNDDTAFDYSFQIYERYNITEETKQEIRNLLK
jgi:uncharacterized protein